MLQFDWIHPLAEYVAIETKGKPTCPIVVPEGCGSRLSKLNGFWLNCGVLNPKNEQTNILQRNKGGWDFTVLTVDMNQTAAG